jgi:predicted RNA-binding Zn-ribbon protein involved in translation (DUF1610 family)
MSSTDQQKPQCGVILPICFLLIFIGVTITMGLSMMEFASGWPIGFPGPSPGLFVWVPFGMAGFATLMLIMIIVGQFRKKRTPDSIPKYDSGVTTYSAEDVLTSETSGYAGPTYIRTLPKFCNNCGSPIDESSVEWIDSMTFSCPHCGKKQRAERKAV